jgi:hypothetical protein
MIRTSSYLYHLRRASRIFFLFSILQDKEDCFFLLGVEFIQYIQRVLLFRLLVHEEYQCITMVNFQYVSLFNHLQQFLQSSAVVP